MPPPEGKAGDLCIWFITCFFFLLILSGGIFLVLYITQPETDETGWFPIVGMALIAIPWIFWILICLYRTVMPCYKPPPTEAVAGPAESQVYSPGGGRRVTFGVATVIGTQDVGDAVNGTAESEAASGSSLGSYEREVPLALSIS
ncbi:hypothetical protein IEQ34_018739 [Dendrobium chrysotoxum]|uniref:Uncharacterized protein n=1 Tax=Dendrobium chrysotoxum TaxID=161865 RepID=A0AAV7FP69_DENCH|nr:hypothetical protein IEQ34_018739 [Dendrobium chrysotoxum]